MIVTQIAEGVLSTLVSLQAHCEASAEATHVSMHKSYIVWTVKRIISNFCVKIGENNK